jgi:hypothetical protein
MFTYTDRDQFLTAYINCSAATSPLPFALDVFSCLSGGHSYYRLDSGTVAPDVLGSCTSTLVLPFNSSVGFVDTTPAVLVITRVSALMVHLLDHVQVYSVLASDFEQAKVDVVKADRSVVDREK